MFWTFHGRLLLVALVHTLFGEAGPFLANSINFFQPFIMPMANQSLHAHYGVFLDTTSYAWLWASFAAMDTLGNFFGSAILWFLLDYVGRRNTVMILRNAACIFFALSQPLNSFELILVARFLMGFSSACSNALYLYLAECSPQKVRGSIQMMLGFGAGGYELLSTIIAQPFILGTPSLWPIFMIFPIIPNLIHTAFARVFPKSPKYLYIYKKNEPAARKSVEYYYGPEADVDEVLDNFKVESRFTASHHITYKLILNTRHLRMPFFVCLVTQLSSIFNGQALAQQYSNAILVLLGVPPEYSLLVILGIMFLSLLLGSLNSFFLIERFGRRHMQLFNICMALLGVSCVFIASLMNPAGTESVSSGTPLASIAIGVTGFIVISLSYAMGIATIPKILIGELCPQASRAKTATAVYLIGNIVTFLIVFTWPPLQQAIGAFSYLPMIVLESICLVWLYKYLPESHNRPVSDIVQGWVDPAQIRKDSIQDQLLVDTGVIGYGSTSTDLGYAYERHLSL